MTYRINQRTRHYSRIIEYLLIGMVGFGLGLLLGAALVVHIIEGSVV